jgi:hypothetical protein
LNEVLLAGEAGGGQNKEIVKNESNLLSNALSYQNGFREDYREFKSKNRCKNTQGMPYFFIQPIMSNTREYKIVLFNGKAIYTAYSPTSVNQGFKFSIEKLVQLYLSDCDLALFEHSERHCIFEEANVCINRRLDNPEIIRKQINRYHQEGYPANAGLGECTILLRRHTPEIIEFNECWWQEILNGSKRDQISFQYVINKLQLKHRYFPGHLRCTNKLFKRHFHANQK